MDRRSWLWRRKSSEKSPGGTESSGSISSHSERFSDDQAFATHSFQSLEASSKAIHTDEEVNDSVKALREKLSAALLNISAKEDMVKQHSKVAEEAVSGWEKAEKEASSLKQQLEIIVRKNLSLEDRIGHLDGALKECVRQLRQGREEQEQKTREAISKKTSEWESIKYEFESQLVELHAQLQIRSVPVDSELHQKLEASEKENSVLKLELLSQAEELELQIIDRDLSNQAAETASKQHLESKKKTAKLEAEIRRLKAAARRDSPANDQKSFTASSIYAESFTDSQSDSSERLIALDVDTRKISGLECEPSHFDSCVSMAPSMDINLMDDFLEMERLVALPDVASSNHSMEGRAFDQCSSMRAELSAMINRTSDLEERLERTEAEKTELKLALTKSEKNLDMSNRRLNEVERKLAELQTRLAMETQLEQDAQKELKAINIMRLEAESIRGLADSKNKTLLSEVATLEHKVKQERALLAETEAKRQNLEFELSEKEHEAEIQREAELQRSVNANKELKVMQEKELAVAASKFSECQKTIASIGQQIKSLLALEDFLVVDDNPVDINTEATCPGGKILSFQSDLSNKKTKSFKILSERLKFSKNDNDKVSSSSQTNPATAFERNRNLRGRGKLYPRSKNDIG